MKNTYAFLSLLLLFSAAFSFTASDYLYPSESASSITLADFTLNSSSSSFTLVKISNNPVFLLKDSLPVSDEAALLPYLREYYQTRLYPSQSELDGLKQFFVDFNNSRDAEIAIFAGSNVKFKAESTCRQQTGLSTITMCNSPSSCDALAGVICALYEGSSCDPGVLGAGIYQYATTVSALDTHSSSAFLALSSMTQDNMGTNLATLASTIAPMKAAAEALTHSTLRMPTSAGDPCYPGACRAGQSCWSECSQLISICPAEILDTAKLDSAGAKITELQSRVATLSQPETVAKQVATATKDRISYKQNAALAADYSAKYESLKARYAPTVSRAQNASALVVNSQLNSKLSSLKSASDAIENSLSSKDFSQINASFARYANASEELKPIVNNSNLTAAYDLAMDAQDDASDALLSAAWVVSANDNAEVSNYNKLVFRMRALDGEFQPPLSDYKYAQLAQNYTQLTSDVRGFIASSRSPQELFVGVGTTVSATSVNGAMSMMNSVVPISFQARQQFSPIILPAVILLTDASLLSIILVAFVFSLIFARSLFTNKIVLGCWIGAVLLMVFLVLVGSIGLFYAMQGSTGISTFSDFYAQVQASPKGIIMLDRTDAPDADFASMTSCAALVKSQLASLNKSSISYTLDGQRCTVGSNATSVSKDECLSKVPDYPIFYLKYSGTNSVKFSVVEQKQATIAGNQAYFARCDIGNVLN